MSEQEKRMVTIEEAMSILNDGETVHTFRSTGSVLLGADHERQTLIDRMKRYSETLQIAGAMARGMKHGLILEDNVGYLFIETDEEKLNAFDPIKVS